MSVCVCVWMSARARVHVCARVCACAHVRACMCVRARVRACIACVRVRVCGPSACMRTFLRMFKALQVLFFRRKTLFSSLQKWTKEAQSVNACYIALYILIVLHINNKIIVIKSSTQIIQIV